MLVKQFTNNPDNEGEKVESDDIKENNEIKNEEILNLNPSSETYIKSKLSLGLIDQILRNPKLSEDERQRYTEIKDEINKYNFYYIYDDINIHDYNLIRNLKEISNEMEEPIKIETNLDEEINYDIEFHKIGTRCSGLKERCGIIKNGKLFSSTKPKNKLDNIKDLKDKTPFLQDAEIIKETKSNVENNKSKGEWGSKKKNYRIRINYYTKPGDLNSKMSSFFLYLDSEESLNEVYLLLCNMRLTFTNKESLKEILDKFNKMLMKRKKFYSIIKILSLKNKIKKRKSFFCSVEHLIKNNVISVNLVQHFLKEKPKEPQKLALSSIVHSDPFKIEKSKIGTDINIIEKEESIINKSIQEKTKLRAINKRKIFYEEPNDNFLPLITNNFFDKSTDKKTLSNLETKLAHLKDIIPSNIIYQNKNESMNNICFNINGIKIEKDDNRSNLTLDPSICENAKYILFNKENNEIFFRPDNKEIENVEENAKLLDVLSSDNIHEISNVIYECNHENNLEIRNSVNEPENVLKIFGPKKDNDTEIKYKYKDYENDEFKYNDDKVYLDPENCSIKSKTINQFNQKEIDGVNLKIIQSQIGANDQNIVDILKEIPENVDKEIKPENIRDELLFGYTVRLGNMKKINGDFFQSIDNNDKSCFLEYNNQYFIPKEYFSKDIIIENYCLPKYNLSGKDNLAEDEISKLGQFLSPVNVGYVKLNYNDLVSNKFEFPIQNNDIDLPNSSMIIDGYPERRKVENLAHIKGKDYSIGGYSYLEKIINGKFFNEGKENEDMPDNIKKKYFDLSVEDDYIYFKPNALMEKEQFEKDILTQISDLEYQKIKNNKIYNFIPYCEKFIDEKSLYESKNLKNLTDEQKSFIVKNYKPGDWIYKVPELKVQLLTKNIAVYKDQGDNKTKIKQYIYCNGKEEDFDIEKITDDKIVAEKIIPISENCFNIFENNESYDLRSIENSNDYQWKVDIKFKNELQMKSFLKLLILFRKNANEKQKLDIDKNEYDMKEIIDFEQKRKGKKIKEHFRGAIDAINGEVKCIINVSFINFIEDIQFNNEKENKPHMRFKLLRGLGGRKKLFLNKLEEFPFKNKLLNNDDIKKYTEDKEYKFDKKLRFDIERYKKGQRMIFFGKNMTSKLSYVFDYDFEIEREYTLLINLFDDDNEKYYSKLNIVVESNEEICNKYEFPIFKQNKENKIFGCIGVDIFEREFMNNILQKYEEVNKEKINNPFLLISKGNNKENDNSIQNYCLFGIYEPNIFRRKILRKINKLNIDPTIEIQNMPNEDIKNLDKILGKKCIKVIPNWTKDIQLNEEVFKKKYILKLIDIQRHEKFLEDYRELEWKSFLESLNHDIKNLTKDDLIQNKKQTDELYNLICFGITSKENREIFYKIFLDVDDLVQKTKEKLRNFINIEDDNLLSHFSSFIENKANIIFSLIDNDCSNLCYLPNSDLNKINSVKKIVKSFFVWAELNIGLDDDQIKHIKYVYFIGMLYITYKLYNYFENENFAFLLLIGLSQKISHFKQQNPLYNGKINYINLFGLVTKLILEKFQPEIYKKFISLNFPIEFFLSKDLSSLYANYFEDELMMRIFDIIIFESGIQGKYIDDMQYLRVLCAIPITLFEFNKKDILECQSVSELESMINNLIFYSFNMNKFKVHLKNNLKKIFVLTSDEFGLKNEKLKWDDKRGKLYKLINVHFRPVYLDNMNYLSKINEELGKQMILGNNVYEKYISQLKMNEELKSIQELYKADFRIIVQISKLQQIYNNEFIDINEFILEISFDKNVDTFPTKELILNFDSKNNKILNINELYYETNFSVNQFPKRIFFILRAKDNKEKIFANFSYKLSNIELMKITNVILENTEENNKYLMDIILYKDVTKDFEQNNFNLYKGIFRPPNYIHSNKIDEELSSFNISNFFFDNKLSNLINNNNKTINGFIINSNYDDNKYEYFRSLNNVIKENNNKSCINEIEKCINDNEKIKDLIKNWLNNSNVSIEEIFYSIALIDKSSCINGNINFLYKIAQTKNRFLQGDEQDRLSIDKLKEMIYSLYKRFMIYFSKSDVDRMIDFLKKGERLFNIKYAFIHKAGNEKQINDFIFDRNRANPKLNNEIVYQIVFDNIDKQLNNYLNYITNNYNITNIPQVVLIYILKTILENSEHIAQYKKNKMNRITLVIEQDNIMSKREFSISYSSSGISSINELNIENITQNDVINGHIDKLLFYKINDLNISSEYSSEKYVSFDKFKKIFFKLPYLSDLLRISLTHNISNNEFENNDNPKEFEFFKVVINYENDIDNNISILDPNNNINNFFNFYFPLNNEIISSESNKDINMNKKIKSSDTINNIIEELIRKLENNANTVQKIEVIKHYLRMIDKIQLYIYYYIDDDNEQNLKYEKIGYFDSLNSIPILKEKNKIALKIILLAENFNLSQSINLKLKSKGYCKIFHSEDKSDFIWKKVKINNNKEDLKGKVKCFNNYETKLNEQNFTLAYNFNY